MVETKQHEEVKDFFNRISDNYSEKYSEKNPFHHWYFNERLHAATDGGDLDLNEKNILDIGTGTGALYDFLIAKGNDKMNFIGCDIAEKMMEESHIPAANRYVGNCYDIDFKIKKFDYIFVLGVTTYMHESEQDKMLKFISESLQPDGTALISFTNKRSLNYILYSMAKPFFLFFRKKGRVAAQSFKTYNYTQKEIRALARGQFKLENLIYINQTFFPLSHMMPNFSIKLAKFIQRRVKKSRLFNFFSAEFLVVLRPIEKK